MKISCHIGKFIIGIRIIPDCPDLFQLIICYDYVTIMLHRGPSIFDTLLLPVEICHIIIFAGN